MSGGLNLIRLLILMFSQPEGPCLIIHSSWWPTQCSVTSHALNSLIAYAQCYWKRLSKRYLHYAGLSSKTAGPPWCKPGCGMRVISFRERLRVSNDWQPKRLSFGLLLLVVASLQSLSLGLSQASLSASASVAPKHNETHLCS